MLRPEAVWLRRVLALLPVDGGRMLNVGSSTGYFRDIEQPWVRGEVFGPLEARQVETVHLDLKPAPGVDLVGDLLDPAFRNEALLGRYDIVLCSNLLEHVTAREELCRALQEVVPDDGYLLVTCPRHYPYHPDPIDTMFRPTVSELSALFPELELALGEEVGGELQWSYFAHYARLAVRSPYVDTVVMALRAGRDLNERQRLKDVFVRTAATCVVMRRRRRAR